MIWSYDPITVINNAAFHVTDLHSLGADWINCLEPTAGRALDREAYLGVMIRVGTSLEGKHTYFVCTKHRESPRTALPLSKIIIKKKAQNKSFEFITIPNPWLVYDFDFTLNTKPLLFGIQWWPWYAPVPPSVVHWAVTCARCPLSDLGILRCSVFVEASLISPLPVLRNTESRLLKLPPYLQRCYGEELNEEPNKWY